MRAETPTAHAAASPGGVAPRGVRVAVLAAVTVVHLLVLYVPRTPSVSTSGLRLDLLVHAAVFAALALAAVWVRWRWLTPTLVAVLLVVEAVVSEAVQALWLPQRSGDVTDLAADLLGAALGLWLGVRAGRSREPGESSGSSRSGARA